MNKSDELRNLVRDHGHKLPKRHGVFYIFPFELEGTRLLLDSWNGSLSYGEHHGTIPLFYFGMNNVWDRSINRERQPEHITQFYIDKVKAELKRRTDGSHN